jgi:hypothetical protein
LIGPLQNYGIWNIGWWKKKILPFDCRNCGHWDISQRHAILYDQMTEEKYIPLMNVDDKQGRFEVQPALCLN